jgi:hypothetical protein
MTQADRRGARTIGTDPGSVNDNRPARAIESERAVARAPARSYDPAVPAPPLACARCPSAQGRSCCEVEGEERLASLTEGDIARIQAATGLARARFVDREILNPEQAAVYEGLRPANFRSIRSGVRLHLRAQGGACVLHDPAEGCRLRADDRPLRCRLYPFEFDELGRMHAEPTGSCHAVDSAPDARTLLASLGTKESTLRRVHAELLAELRADARTAPR